MADLIKNVRLAETIAEHIEQLVLEGAIRPGEKLAAERDLAETLGVSRPSLREALAILEKKGLVATTKGGTHVTQFLAPLTQPLAKLLADKPQVTEDYFEYRSLVEVHASRLAALRATDVDRQGIRECLERMRRASKQEDPTEEARADTDLHLTIYEATHNLVLVHLVRVFTEMMRANVIYNWKQLYRDSGVRQELLKQHVLLGEAVIEGDGQRAEQAAAHHIDYTFRTIQGIRAEEERLAESLRRVSRSDLVAR
jgi:GntR family transcriptional repressor for pyruvate dehydrogenase complex